MRCFLSFHVLGLMLLILIHILLCTVKVEAQVDITGYVGVSNDLGYGNPSSGGKINFHHLIHNQVEVIGEFGVFHAPKLYLNNKGIATELIAGGRWHFLNNLCNKNATLFLGAGVKSFSQTAPNGRAVATSPYIEAGIRAKGSKPKYEILGRYKFKDSTNKFQTIETIIEYAPTQHLVSIFEFLIAPNFTPQFQPDVHLTGIRTRLGVGYRF